MSQIGSWPLRRSAVLVLLAMLGGLLTIGGGVHGVAHADGLSLIGAVTDAATGAPVGGIGITVIDGRGITIDTTSLANGTYSVAGLESYDVEFHAHDDTGTYAAVSEELVMTGDPTVHDVHLVAGGTISGHVTSESGVPIPGVCLSVSRPGGFAVTSDVCTDANGAYETYGLPTDSYSVYFSATRTGYFSEYYADALTFEGSTDVIVIPGATTIADAQLERGGRVVGRISSAVGGTGVVDASIRFESATSPVSYFASSGTDGRYASPALPPGSYTVLVRPEDGVHVPRYAGGTAAASTAVAITVGTGDEQLDVAVLVGGAIEGTVTDVDGRPIAGACVYAANKVCADASGRYHSGGLEPGAYYVDAEADGYEEVLSDAPVVVTTATIRYDITLHRLGVLRGTVTVAVKHAPIASGTVDAYLDGEEYPSASADVAPDGTYELAGLIPGAYVLLASPDPGSADAPTTYGGTQTRSGATTLSLHLDDVVAGVDIQLTRGSVLAGTVTSATTGAPLDDACVYADAVDGFRASRQACTDAGGHYSIAGLGAASYIVEFLGLRGRDLAYELEYYDDVHDPAAPSPVPVAVWASIVANASLTPLAEVSGTVRDAEDGAPVARVLVGLEGTDAGSTQWSAAFTDDAGHYVAFARPGSYIVQAGGASSRHADQFYDHQRDVDHAALLVVAASGAGGIDFDLADPGAVRGTITAGGAPVSGVRVLAHVPTDSVGWEASTITASDGSYELALAPGSYVIEAIDLKSRYVGEWYPNAAGPAGASVVPIDLEDEVTVDMDLTRGGAIEGLIADVMHPAEVQIYAASGTVPVAVIPLDYAEAFITDALAAGQYKVSATGPGGRTLFYGGTDLASAAVVNVVPGRVTRHIDLPSTVVPSDRVTGLAAAGGDAQVTLSWSPPTTMSSIAVGTRIEVSADGGATWSTRTTIADVATGSVVVDGLANGVAHSFRVTPILTSGSARSSVVAATPRGLASVPRGLSLVVGDGALTASWAAPLSDGGLAITDYELQRSADGGSTWITVVHTASAATAAVLPTTPGTYLVRVAAINLAGRGPRTAASAPAVVPDVASSGPAPAVAPFVALAAPARILDTRPDGETIDGLFQRGGRRAAGSLLALQVGGRAGLADDAGSVVLNVSVVGAGADGYITAFPCGVQRPITASVTYSAGQTVANQVIARAGTNGQVCLFTYGATDLVVDVSGALPPGAAYDPLPSPVRLLDTRPAPDGATVDGLQVGAGRVAAGTVRELPIAGRAGVPAGATSIVLNLTAVAPSAAGFITIFPCGVPRPNAANLNMVGGHNVANAVIAKLDARGTLCIYSSAATDVVVDVSGDFSASTSFAPLAAPARLLDTRPAPEGATIDGQSVGIGRRPAGSILELHVGGRAGAATDAGSVVLNVTAVAPSGDGFLTVYPCGVPRPNAANVTYVAGQVVPNAVITKVGNGGSVCIFTYAETDVVVDIAGTLA